MTLETEPEDEERDLLTLGGRIGEMKAEIGLRDPVKKRCVFLLITTSGPALSLTYNTIQAPTPPAQTDEAKKAERLAKLEAWKQKQAAEKDRKQKELESSGGARTILAEIDKKEQDTPIVASPMSPATPLETVTPTSPTPYAGKFDPKAIARKAAAASSSASKLGTDIALPEISKASATNKSNVNGLKANKSPALANGTSSKPFIAIFLCIHCSLT